MITFLVALLVLLLGLVLWFFLFPVRVLRDPKVSREVLCPPDVYVYSFVIHIHTQFSHDSLGKPEDVERSLKECGVDYALVTDHDNDLISSFAGERILPGKEIKLTDGNGNLAGDVLDFGDLKVIAHPFTEKYRWRLEKNTDYLLEIVDLKDEILRSKVRLFLLVLGFLVLYPVMRGKVLRHLSRVVDLEKLALRYLREGWRNPVVGGLDHHVKIYVNDAGRKVLVPDYRISFSILRNFLITEREVRNGRDLLRSLKEGRVVLSFSEKVTLVWNEDTKLKVYSPFDNTLVTVLSPEGRTFEVVGPNCTLDLKPGRYMVLGFTYIFRVWKFLFGLRPLFLSYPLEVKDEGETSS